MTAKCLRLILQCRLILSLRRGLFTRQQETSVGPDPIKTSEFHACW